MGETVEAGYEHVRLKVGGNRRRPDVRWWFFLADGDFRFARGGRTQNTRQAKAALAPLYAQAMDEKLEYRHRPTHMLGAAGELIPVESLLRPELEA